MPFAAIMVVTESMRKSICVDLLMLSTYCQNPIWKHIAITYMSIFNLTISFNSQPEINIKYLEMTVMLFCKESYN